LDKRFLAILLWPVTGILRRKTGVLITLPFNLISMPWSTVLTTSNTPNQYYIQESILRSVEQILNATCWCLWKVLPWL
jgi:hypothetical protein